MLRDALAAYTISWMRSIEDIDKQAWNALALPQKSPFMEWEWLYLMEATGCVGNDKGWLPLHLTVWSGTDLLAAAPMYIKSHSSGEFTFDHIWAEAAQQLGIQYYPKIVGMSPFTPMPGYRFLIGPSDEEEKLSQLMVEAIDRLCQRAGLSGCHFLYIDQAWRKRMESLGFISWEHQGFRWENYGYRDFEDFLSVFKSNQRRNIKRELKSLSRQGISTRTLEGDAISLEQMRWMFHFYERTNAQFGPWACKFLNRGFFEALPDFFKDRLLLVRAQQNGEASEPVGMSLLVHKEAELFGRYWGSREEISGLHFNVCYYTPIDWAIERGVKHFDPGIGGQHKHRRGFVPLSNYSLHRFYQPLLQRIFKTHIQEINRWAQRQIEVFNRDLPFAERE
jgi:hypothetical protein